MLAIYSKIDKYGILGLEPLLKGLTDWLFSVDFNIPEKEIDQNNPQYYWKDKKQIRFKNALQQTLW